jgi:hypothetical protein
MSQTMSNNFLSPQLQHLYPLYHFCSSWLTYIFVILGAQMSSTTAHLATTTASLTGTCQDPPKSHIACIEVLIHICLRYLVVAEGGGHVGLAPCLGNTSAWTSSGGRDRYHNIAATMTACSHETSIERKTLVTGGAPSCFDSGRLETAFAACSNVDGILVYDDATCKMK